MQLINKEIINMWQIKIVITCFMWPVNSTTYSFRSWIWFESF